MNVAQVQGLAWRIGIAYEFCGVPQAFELLMPMRPWDPGIGGVSGHDTATSGVQESIVLREDELYDLKLRFTETEWHEKVKPWLRAIWAQAQVFTVQLDVRDAATIHAVQLEAPWGEAKPSRGNFKDLLELTVTVRTEDGSPMSYPFFRAIEGY